MGPGLVNGTGAHCPSRVCKPELPKVTFGAPQPQARKGLAKPNPIQISVLRVCAILAPHPQRPPDLSWGRPNLRGPWQALESSEGPGTAATAQQLWAVGRLWRIQSREREEIDGKALGAGNGP